MSRFLPAFSIGVAALSSGLHGCSGPSATPPEQMPPAEVDAGAPDGGPPDGAHSDGGAPESPTPDGGAASPDGGGAGPADPCLHDFSRASVVTALRAGNQAANDPATGIPADACCFDFTGDGRPDNKLGQLLRLTNALLGTDGNSLFAEGVATGAILKLFTFQGLADLRSSPSVDVNLLDGADTDGDPANNGQGTGTFVARSGSFGADGRASSRFTGGALANGRLSAGPATVRMPFVLAGAMLDLPLAQARIEGDVSIGPDGKGVSLGSPTDDGMMLGGVVRRRDFAAALNERVRACGCLRFPDGGEAIALSEPSMLKCRTPVDNTCAGAGDPFCESFASTCGVTLSMLSADVDLDGDGAKSSLSDGLSVGYRVRATSASVTGVEGCR